VPFLVPVFVLLISAYLVIAPIIENPSLEYLYALMFIVSGLIFYVPFVHIGYTSKTMGEFTVFFILLIFLFCENLLFFFRSDNWFSAVVDGGGSNAVSFPHKGKLRRSVLKKHCIITVVCISIFFQFHKSQKVVDSHLFISY
jgi:hypothetical protein